MASKTTDRLQKDLLGYNDHYAAQLETLIGSRMQEMAPEYRRLQAKAVGYLEQLNREVETVSADRRLSKRFQQRIQQMYVTQILPDLELLNAAQQPYFTEVLAGTLQYGYYTTAYSLEQAAKVAVTVPILNRAGVLGLIANPWLPDKKTYSDRIRANVQLVADKTTDTVKDLVTKRLSYNEAARALRGQIGESYYNATRLIRTEMTRANGLGTSYAAMENADLLDGKYRDATFDIRTSPRCAADADYSRKNLYPLDYDTPVNPGVPGKRIPNHPHCRCRWCTVLSTVGVTSRKKAARAEDGPNSFGKKYFTDEATYDGYAKERGLPSVKAMLEADNPKRYLRPGETVESLNKRVKRYRVGDATIVASIAPWDSVTTMPVAAPAVPQRSVVNTANLNSIYGPKHADAMGKIVDVAPDSVRNTWIDFENDIRCYDTSYRGSGAHYSRLENGVRFNMTKHAKGSSYETPYQVAFHEFGHNIDYEMNMRYGSKERYKTITETFKDGLLGKTTKEEAAEHIRKYTDTHYAEFRALVQQRDIDAIVPDFMRKVKRGFYEVGEQPRYTEISIRRLVEEVAEKKLSTKLTAELTLLQRGDISDMFEGATDAKVTLGIGHGKAYWAGRDNGKEVFAEMFSATMCNDASLEQIQKYFPESYRVFLEIMELVK